jgi:glycosyltransferase involved in cell wall biosynthesis
MLKPFPSEQVTVIPFEKNFYELYHLFDMFVHVPIGREYEAFGQIYVEAMAASIPCVVTMAGIALEIVKDDYNAIVVDYKNSEQITKALLALSTDQDLRQKLIQNGRTTVDKRFEYSRYISELETLYTRIYKREI